MSTNWRLLTKTRECLVESMQTSLLAGESRVAQLTILFAAPDGQTTRTRTIQFFQVPENSLHCLILSKVSGARCATDFVELPSILMEHFLNSPTVLSLFDLDGTSATCHTRNHHEDPCRSIDTHSQILLAMLDQEYHSADVLNSDFDSTATLARLHDTHGPIPFVPGTSFQTQFSHLFGYGATYHSYLFDRTIASRVWGKVFSNNPLSRETGERYKRKILRHGGGRDPWAMVGSLLQASELGTGDAEAMREVGRWRIEDDVSVPGRH